LLRNIIKELTRRLDAFNREVSSTLASIVTTFEEGTALIGEAVLILANNIVEVTEMLLVSPEEQEALENALTNTWPPTLEGQ